MMAWWWERMADLIVEDTMIVELKVAKEITAIHEAQLINYLRATGIRIGLILNFGQPRLGIRRLVV
jgi:GxxExxY protein